MFWVLVWYFFDIFLVNSVFAVLVPETQQIAKITSSAPEIPANCLLKIVRMAKMNKFVSKIASRLSDPGLSNIPENTFVGSENKQIY